MARWLDGFYCLLLKLALWSTSSSTTSTTLHNHYLNIHSYSLLTHIHTTYKDVCRQHHSVLHTFDELAPYSLSFIPYRRKRHPLGPRLL